MECDPILAELLQALPLTCIRNSGSAGLLLASIPLPRHASLEHTLGGRPTFAKALGRWYDANSPRRVILAADSGGEAPPHLTVNAGAVQGHATPLAVAMETFEHAPASDMPLYYWERSQLTVSWGGKTLGLAMGLRVREETHWWEGCNIVILSESPECVEVEMGGAIPYEVTTGDTARSFDGADNPFIHKHNWVNGHIYLRLHANGVCEVYAHHINSMAYDDGADFKDAVPVIGFKTVGGEQAVTDLGSVWDGSRVDLRLGEVAFDFTDVARLATPEKPGRLYCCGDFVVLQPYRGVEVHGGDYTRQRSGDEYLWRAEDEIFPRGMARTLRFSLSLNAQRSPRVARYVAPAWWYGLCEEYQARPLLPVSNAYDETPRSASAWFDEHMIAAGFVEGLTPFLTPAKPGAMISYAYSQEGDIPGALLLAAYRAGDAAVYDHALRATYALVDVAVDHAVHRLRIMAHEPDAVSVCLQRMHGALMGWLETGDPYLINTAQAVIENAYWWHKNSWPRRAVGRDARFVHSLTLLYRYLGQGHYLDRTRDIIADLAASQWPDGSFGDQGGGSGIHGHPAYIVKPWMGCLATLGVLDYLDLCPDDSTALAVVAKFIDFLMRERAPRVIDRSSPEAGTAMGWTYQHRFKGKALPGYEMSEGPTEGTHLVHLDYLGRLLGWYSLHTGDPRYFVAFAESYEGAGPSRDGAYHSGTGAMLCIPWLQDRLWNATLSASGVALVAVYAGAHTPRSARILAPGGNLEVAWMANGEMQAPDGVQCRIVDLTKPRA